jgi:hypothetical protein
MNALDFWVGLVLRGGSVGGASAIRSSCRSGERRTSFRGERGDCGGFHWFASPMIGLEMSRGLSFLEKRRKIDAFLNSGGGLCGFDSQHDVECIDPSFAIQEQYLGSGTSEGW